MEWRTHSDIEITDLGDRLEVLIRTQKGKAEWLILAVGSPLGIYLFLRTSSVVGIVAAIVIVFSILNMIRKGNETRLIARADGFIAEGNVNRTFADRVSLSVDDIHSVGYSAGYEDEPNGFYALGPWRRTCLIPGIDEDSCLQIKEAIERKFPEMLFGQEPHSGLFGDGPTIITLGLNKPDPAKSK
jgi:hypothetical protein